MAAAQISQVLLSKGIGVQSSSSYNGAKLAIELLETATTQTVQRMGWFRDVRLRRVADAFLRSSQIYQQAAARKESEGGGYGFEKPSTEKIEEYTDDLKSHVSQLQARLRVVPNNERREINIKLAGHGKAIGPEAQRRKEMKDRDAELKRNPSSVRKAVVGKKRRGLRGKANATKADMEDED